jgi:hypothetical protein
MMRAIEQLDDYYCLDYHMDFITSNISHKKRDDILKTFASSTKIELLFSCRILDECIDIPSCDSIFITYPSQSKIRTIQRLCRCIRIDKNNKYKKGCIFIWCDEYSKILETLSGIKEYDVEFRDKIKLNINGSHGIGEDKGLCDDKKLISDYCMEIKEFRDISWDDKLEMVKKYIDENTKRPNINNRETITRQLGIWIYNQTSNYKKKEDIMKQDKIYNKWTNFINDNKYKEYFSDNITIWLNTFIKIKEYIDINKEKPSSVDYNNNIKKLGRWIITQNINYKKNIDIMKNEEIYNKWTDFINDDKYKEYFLDNINIWLNTLGKVKKYIIANNNKPYRHDINNDIKHLGKWIDYQFQIYKSKSKIMANENIYNKWIEFINDPLYKEYFLDNNIIWYNNLEKVKNYINTYNKRPSKHNKDNNITQLGYWIGTQSKNYKKNLYIMSDKIIYNKWIEFINDPLYKEYFLDNNTIWLNNLDKVKNYIITNKTKPSRYDINNDISQLGRWIDTQFKNYKFKIEIMTNKEIYNKWTDFINDPLYKENFLTNTAIWLNNLDKIKNYININNKRPTSSDNDINIKQLGVWIVNQSKNYKSKSCIMMDINIYNKWTEFINDPLYKEYFLDNTIIWLNNLDKVKKYIISNNKKPSTEDSDDNIKQLGIWINTQLKNYKIKSYNMANDIIYNKWTKFINDPLYKEYFLDNKIIWIDNLEKVIYYINTNDKIPTQHDKDNNIKQLGVWIQHQSINYKSKTKIMANIDIYNKWTTFINNPLYKEYFLDNTTIWLNKLDKVKEYININNKRPSKHNEDNNIKQLGNWIGSQSKNYKLKLQIMKNQEIYNIWTTFINDPLYKQYFE